MGFQSWPTTGNPHQLSFLSHIHVRGIGLNGTVLGYIVSIPNQASLTELHFFNFERLHLIFNRAAWTDSCICQKFDFENIFYCNSLLKPTWTFTESWLQKSMPEFCVWLVFIFFFRQSCQRWREVCHICVPKQFEFLILNVGPNNNAQMTLVGMYCPPSAPPCALSKLSKFTVRLC